MGQTDRTRTVGSGGGDKDLDVLRRLAGIYVMAVQRHLASSALRESEERFRLISETIHVGVFEIDTDGNCLYTNTRYQEIFGLNVVQSLTTHWHDYVSKDEWEQIVRLWQAAADDIIAARSRQNRSSS